MGGPHGVDDVGPVLGRGRRPDPIAPRPCEHLVQHQHGHVAAHAVALVEDPDERGGRRAAESRRERVELDHVGPGGEVRVAPAGEDPLADTHERSRIAFEVVVAPGHEVVGMLEGPRVIGSDVVGHEVEDQAHPPVREGPARRCQTRRPAKPLVDDVLADAVRRTDDVVGREVGQDPTERWPHDPGRPSRSRSRPGCVARRPSARRRPRPARPTGPTPRSGPWRAGPARPPRARGAPATARCRSRR